jgi:hypothetical protein
MANARFGNTHYVDASGVLTSNLNQKVAGVIVTATAASAILALADSGGTDNQLNLRVATSGETVHFDFSAAPIVFPNGIKAVTVTNAICTLIYTS